MFPHSRFLQTTPFAWQESIGSGRISESLAVYYTAYTTKKKANLAHHLFVTFYTQNEAIAETKDCCLVMWSDSDQ